MAEKVFPKVLYVRLDENNDPHEQPIIISERSIEDTMDGDEEQEIGEYKFVKKVSARKVIRIS